MGKVKRILGWIGAGWKWFRNHGTTFAAALALAAVVYLIVLQLEEKTPDSTTLALVGLGTALLFGLLAPGATAKLLRRMTSFKVAGVVEVGMEAVVLAEIVRPPIGDEDGLVAERKNESYEDVVAELKDKMQFIYAITNMSERVKSDRSHREIAHVLAADHLIDEDEAQFALDLLTGRDWGLAELSEKAEGEFLDAAWSYAARFHFGVWDRFVRSELTERGWIVADFRQAPGHRRDFLACWKGEWVLMTARVGGRGNPWPYPATRNRLAREEFKVPIEGRCIVIPGGDRTATVVKDGKGADSNVKVLQLQGSLREDPERAFDRSKWNDDADPRRRQHAH